MSNEDDLKGLFEPTGGQLDDLFSNFGMLIPKGCFKDVKTMEATRFKKLLCKIVGHRWGLSGISHTGPGHPRLCKRCLKFKWFKKIRSYKWVDSLLRSLCRIGIHRWKATYQYVSYSNGTNYGSFKVESHYQCVRCKNKKTITK